MDEGLEILAKKCEIIEEMTEEDMEIFRKVAVKSTKSRMKLKKKLKVGEKSIR